MLRRLAPFALAMFALPALAGTTLDSDECNLDSDWSLKPADSALAFSREGDAKPGRVELSGGVLRVDGREIALSAADRDRLRAYERTVRELIPEVQEIALDAIEIAFVAVDEVARGFAGDDPDQYARTAEKLATARITARRHIEDAFEGRGWSEAEVERLVEEAVTEMVPVLVSDVVATAVRVALSGDEAAAEALEARAERLEREIETKVEGRAKELERRAEGLCVRLVELDRLEADLDVEIAPGQRFDLVRVEN
jgi:hypothetical protein